MQGYDDIKFIEQKVGTDVAVPFVIVETLLGYNGSNQQHELASWLQENAPGWTIVCLRQGRSKYQDNWQRRWFIRFQNTDQSLFFKTRFV
jgi:invasion protein IalB